MADPDVPPSRARPFVALAAAFCVGAVVGAAVVVGLVRRQPVPPPPAPPPVAAAKPETPGAAFTPVALDGLPGWHEDSTAEALPALRRSCVRLKAVPPERVIGAGEIARPASAWHAACDALARVTGGDGALRAALADIFTAYRVTAVTGDRRSEHGLFTGYYEADLRGASAPGGSFRYPIYGLPRNLVSVDVREFVGGAVPQGAPASLVGRVVAGARGLQMKPYFTREEIDRDGLIAADADVLVWADDPVAVHILHIQGSGRVTLPDGSVMRLGFAGSNGRAFKGVGSILLEAGALKPGGASMIAVRDWLQAHPDEAAGYMNRNTRYIFFRKVADSEVEDGPLGASNVSLAPGRSLAVDPRFIPLGAPLWLDTKDPDDIPLQRLMVAQDTGAAITGAVRGDFFWGHGDDAFLKAARMKSTGGYAVLVPKAPPPVPGAGPNAGPAVAPPI